MRLSLTQARPAGTRIQADVCTESSVAFGRCQGLRVWQKGVRRWSYGESHTAEWAHLLEACRLQALSLSLLEHGLFPEMSAWVARDKQAEVFPKQLTY